MEQLWFWKGTFVLVMIEDFQMNNKSFCHLDLFKDFRNSMYFSKLLGFLCKCLPHDVMLVIVICYYHCLREKKCF